MTTKNTHRGPDSRLNTGPIQPTSEKNSDIRSATILVAITGSFITPFMGSSVNVILPAIEKSLNINALLLSWVATAYLLAAGITLVPMGRLGDILGRKKILAVGFSFFAEECSLLFRVFQHIVCFWNFCFHIQRKCQK